jgi:hypothetical protein
VEQPVRCDKISLVQRPGAIYILTLYPRDNGLFDGGLREPIVVKLDRRSPMVGYHLAAELTNSLGLYVPFLVSCLNQPVLVDYAAEFAPGLIVPKLTVDSSYNGVGSRRLAKGSASV